MGLIIVARLYADLKMFCYLERMVNKKHFYFLTQRVLNSCVPSQFCL